MPALAEFISTSSTGELEISQSGYEYVLNEQVKGAKRLQTATLLSQAQQSKAQSDIDKKIYNSSSNRNFEERQNAKISYQSSEIQSEQLTATAFDQLLENYEEAGAKLSDNNKILAKEVLANKKNLKTINEKQRTAKVDKALYGQLVGLTEAQVQEQLDNKELSKETIKATIAINEYQKEYANQIRELSAVANGLDPEQSNALGGTNLLTERQIRKINTEQFKQFKNNLGEVDLSNSDDYEKAKELLGKELNFTNEELSRLWRTRII